MGALAIGSGFVGVGMSQEAGRAAEFDLDEVIKKLVPQLTVVLPLIFAIIVSPEKFVSKPAINVSIIVITIVATWLLARHAWKVWKSSKNESTAFGATAALLFLFGGWYVTPESVNPVSPSQVRSDVYRVITGRRESPQNTPVVISTHVEKLTVRPGAGVSKHVPATVENAIKSELARRTLPANPRKITIVLDVDGQAGSAVSDSYRLTARVALRAANGDQCQFILEQDRSYRVQAAAEQLARGIVDRAIHFIGGAAAG